VSEANHLGTTLYLILTYDGAKEHPFSSKYRDAARSSVMLHTNQAIDMNTLSRRVLAHGKASKRRCSTPTASFDHTVREPTQDGLS
jgi:hypothetical protein